MDRKRNWVILYMDSVPIHVGHQLVSKEITIKEQREEKLHQLIVEIATKSDPFDTYSVVINELDYKQKFQHGQQVTAPFQDFSMLLIDILKKLRDPRQKYDAYLESLNSVKSNLAITYTTPLKNTNQLVIEVLKVSNDQLKDVVYSIIDNLKVKIGQLEDKNNKLTTKLEEVEAENTAENYHAKYLQEIANREERLFILDRQHEQNVDEYLNRMAELTSYLAHMKNEYTNMHTMKEECIMKNQAVYLQLEIVERERKESYQRCLLVEERNKVLEKQHVEFIETLEHFRKQLEEGAATLEEYGQIIAAKNRENDKLLCRLAKLEEDLKRHPALPPDTDVGDAAGREEEPRNKVSRCTVGYYLQTKFSEEKDKQ